MDPIRKDENLREIIHNQAKPDVYIEYAHIDDNKRMIRGNCPQQSLRRFLIIQNKWESYKDVFCDFQQTIHLMSMKDQEFKKKMISKIIRDASRYDNVETSEDNESFSDDDSNSSEEDVDDDTFPKNDTFQRIYGFKYDVILKCSAIEFSILFSLLYRIHKSYVLYDKCQEKRQDQVLLDIQLCIDTHIHLSRWMIKYDAYSDILIKDESSNIESIIHSAYKLYYPSFELVSSCGNLPALVDFIEQGNTWYEIFSKQQVDNEVYAMIHLFCCKTETQKCQKRNFTEILLKYFNLYPALIQLYRQFMCISLLGNYPFCKRRTNYTKRLEIYHFFWTSLSRESFFYSWMSQNYKLAHYCTKEYHIYLVESQYAFDIIKSDTTKWTIIKNITKEALDIVRSYVNNITLKKDMLKECDIELETSHKQSLKFLKKLKKGNFIDISILETKKHYDKDIIKKFSIETQHSEDNISNDVLESMDMVIRKRYSRHVDNKLELRWLKCFGITERGYDLIRNLYFDYEVNDMPDNAINLRYKEITAHSVQDFHIIRTYFKKIFEYKAFAVYPLPLHVAENQLNAIKAKNVIFPWESLPENLENFAYCPSCKKWANPIVHPIIEKTKSNVYSLGFEEALYDEENDCLFCGKSNRKSNIKQLLSTQINSDTMEVEDSKVAKSIRKHKDQPKCLETPLNLICMIGVIVKLNGKLWAICEICASLMEFNATKFSKLGLTCGRHDKDSKFNHLVKASFTKLFVVQRLQREQMNKKIKFSSDFDRMKYAYSYGKSSMITEIQSNMNRNLLDKRLKDVEQDEALANCLYCKSNGMEKEGTLITDYEKKNNRTSCILYRIDILDDEDYPIMKKKTAFLCSKDFKTVETFLEDVHTIRKSKLLSKLASIYDRKISKSGSVK